MRIFANNPRCQPASASTNRASTSTFDDFRLSIGVLAALLISALFSLSSCLPCSAQQSPAIPLQNSPSALPATVRVTLSKPVYWITADPKTGAPRMPKDVVATAELLNQSQEISSPVIFTWRVYLDWEFDKYQTHHSISALKFERPSPFPIDLSKQIAGGKLKVFAKATVGGKEIFGQAIADVRAHNPPKQSLLAAFPPNRSGLIASKICMAESDLKQFTHSKGADPGGIPYTSRTSDVGMMQLNITSEGLTSPDQVWDWRANLKRGLEMINSKKRVTKLASRSLMDRRSSAPSEVAGYPHLLCINAIRISVGLDALELPEALPLSETPGSGILPEDSDPDRLALSQLERDAIRRYNGGREYSYAVVPDIEGLGILSAGWQIDPTRGGIRAKSGDPDYVKHVLAARSGFKIPPPPKPVAKSSGKKRHRRHRKH